MAAKNPHLRLQVFIEFRERHVQLQGIPKPQLRVTRIAAAHQQIQGCIMQVEQISGDMRADVPRPSGQEYRHFPEGESKCGVRSVSILELDLIFPHPLAENEADPPSPRLL